MLFDRRWEAKADPYSLTSLAAWLETQPPQMSYKYTSANYCMLAQYFRELGMYYVPVLPFRWIPGKRARRLLESLAAARPHTFGAALDRVRAELRK